MSAHGPLYTCCTVHVSTRTAVHLLHCACQHTDRSTLVALCMSAHGPLYTCCTVHVSTRTAVHLLHYACQYAKSCTLVALCLSVREQLYICCTVHVSTQTAVHCSLMCRLCTSTYPPFLPYITWLQRLNRGRIFIKFYINVLNKTFLRKGESRQKSAIGSHSLL